MLAGNTEKQPHVESTPCLGLDIVKCCMSGALSCSIHLQASLMHSTYTVPFLTFAHRHYQRPRLPAHSVMRFACRHTAYLCKRQGPPPFSVSQEWAGGLTGVSASSWGALSCPPNPARGPQALPSLAIWMVLEPTTSIAGTPVGLSVISLWRCDLNESTSHLIDQSINQSSN